MQQYEVHELGLVEYPHGDYEDTDTGYSDNEEEDEPEVRVSPTKGMGEADQSRLHCSNIYKHTFL